MNKKTLIIGGSVLGLFVLAYFVFRKKNDVSNPETRDENKVDSADNSDDSSENNEIVLVDNKKPPKQNPVKEDVVPSKNISDEINFISINSIGKTLEIEERLSKASAKFINAWYNAIKLRNSTSNKKGTTFLYNEEVYDSFYGIKRIQFYPIGKLAEAKKDAYAYKNAEIGGSKVSVSKGKYVGIVKGYKFNPKDKNIWLYIPDTTTNVSLTKSMDLYNDYRWIPFSNFYLVVPSK